jgi:hypothetical protein
MKLMIRIAKSFLGRISNLRWEWTILQGYGLPGHGTVGETGNELSGFLHRLGEDTRFDAELNGDGLPVYRDFKYSARSMTSAVVSSNFRCAL